MRAFPKVLGRGPWLVLGGGGKAPCSGSPAPLLPGRGHSEKGSAPPLTDAHLSENSTGRCGRSVLLGQSRPPRGLTWPGGQPQGAAAGLGGRGPAPGPARAACRHPATRSLRGRGEPRVNWEGPEPCSAPEGPVPAPLCAGRGAGARLRELGLPVGGREGARGKPAVRSDQLIESTAACALAFRHFTKDGRADGRTDVSLCFDHIPLAQTILSPSGPSQDPDPPRECPAQKKPLRVLWRLRLPPLGAGAIGARPSGSQMT